MKTTTIKRLLAFSFFIFHFSFFIFSQNVGINTTGALPNASAILDLSNSASMALLAPQVALTDVTFLAPVPGPGPAGLIVYNTNPSTNGGSGTGFYYWDGAQWNYLLTGSTSGWSLTGNTGTNPAVNYLGTNDPEDMVFKTFSTERMRILSSGGVGIGTSTPQNMLDVNGGEAIGTYAGVNAAPANGLIVSGQVGVGTSSPDPSAITDLTSTNNGFLVPRMSTAQMNAIANPALSLVIYNTTTNCFMFYTGVQWQPMACICSGAPSAPGTITGDIGVCTGANGIVYSIASVSGATSYNWNVPSGANIVSGQGTTGITVNYGNTPGNLSVTASNSCGTSLATTEAITIYTAPNAPGSITGNTNPAINFSYTYTIATVSGATSYNWTLSGSGASIVSGQGTTSISISYGATPGSYTLCVYDSNACGISAPGPCLSITSTNCQHGVDTFHYTGATQTWSVPGCVTAITLEVWGARGGNADDRLPGSHTWGKGGYASGVLAVSGGTVSIFAGDSGSNLGKGAYNGGAAGGLGTPSNCNGGYGGDGGGASDVRYPGNALGDRVIVAGGGGGSGRDYCNGGCQPCGCGGSGGYGGGAVADNGDSAYNCGFGAPGTGINFGGGGTAAAGGTAGPCDGGGGNVGTVGSLGSGGVGAVGEEDVSGGGGGGGYYGGGGGGGASNGSGVGGGGGGGGSSYTGGVSNGATLGDYNNGIGYVILMY